MKPESCDIFCKVIDNFGDIGVSWRLARQLAHEHGLAVRLWVDVLASFRPLAPALDVDLAQQWLDGVQVCRWDEAADQASPAQLVIEAFGCELPAAYLAAMAASTPRPVWLDLEYLSAEDWVPGFHAMPSPHPRLPLTRHFFYPGFTPETGGLLREKDLCQRLQAWRADAPAVQAFWQRLGCAPALDALRISLFAYENAAIPGLLDAWADGEREIFSAVTTGRHVPQVQAWLAARGGTLRQGRLQLALLPFLAQPDYDHLLAACDLNFVRGEDSFVRAQWAAQPFVWHIYQQDGGAHLPKLAAFLARYSSELATAPAIALQGFWQAWEAGDGAGAQWPALLAHLPTLQQHARAWQQKLVTHADLAANVLIFSKNLLECRAL